MTLTLTTPTDTEITITRVFNASRDLVFECYTKPELVRRWLGGPEGWTFAICDIDLRVGGTYRYEWHGPNAAKMSMGGVYREILTPEKIINTQLFDEDWTGGEAIGTLELSEHHDQTTVTTSVLYVSKEARDIALQSGMEYGLNLGYDKLKELLKTL
jgi:uncharacterized protein YndB with AHSA1/START domain